MVYNSPSPKKRPRTDSASSHSLLEKHTERFEIVLEHIQHVEILSPASSVSQNYQKALRAAKYKDLQWSLSPSRTVVQKRPLVIPPHPQTFIHTHPKSHTNNILASAERATFQRAAYRIFLECFYYECGFRPWYQQPEYVNEGIHPYIQYTDFIIGTTKGKEKQIFSAEDRVRYVRWDAVMNTLPEIGNMEKREAVFLVGRLSGLNQLHRAHHELGVRPMAVYLERLSKDRSPESRKSAVLKAFSWMTKYETFEAAYENENESRIFSDEGLLPGKDAFAIPDEVDLEGDTQLDALGRDVSVLL